MKTIAFRTDNPDFLPITCPIGSDDFKTFVSIVDQGIDSHLEAFTLSRFGVQKGCENRFVFDFHKSELPLLMRRLSELEQTETIEMWIEDIKWEAHKMGLVSSL